MQFTGSKLLVLLLGYAMHCYNNFNSFWSVEIIYKLKCMQL